MISPNSDGFITCPNCNKAYKPFLERKTDNPIQQEHPKATSEEREQLISGLCSTKCWNEFLGLPSIEENPCENCGNNMYDENVSPNSKTICNDCYDKISGVSNDM